MSTHGATRLSPSVKPMTTGPFPMSRLGRLLLSCALTGAACGAGEAHLPDVSSARRVEAQCPPTASESHYFPDGELAPIRVTDTRRRLEYTVMLQQAEQ